MSEESFGEDEDWETGSDGPHALSTDGEWSDCQSDVDEPPPKRRGLGSWTDEDIAEFRHLCYSGTKGPALQKIFGLTADQVKKRKRDLQLTNLDKNPAALPSLSLLQTVWTKRLDGEIPLCEMRPLAAAIAEQPRDVLDREHDWVLDHLDVLQHVPAMLPEQVALLHGLLQGGAGFRQRPH